MVVGNDKLDAKQAALFQPRQEIAPARPALTVGQLDPEHLAPTLAIDRHDLAEVRRDIAQRLAKWQAKYPKLCDWAEDNIEETLTYYRLPLAHHKHMKSTNMLERLNQ